MNSNRFNYLHAAVLAALSFLMFYPLLWMFSNSFKDASQILNYPENLMPSVFNFSNFEGAMNLAPFGTYIFNSVFTAVVIVVLQIILSSMIAYAMTQYDFFGKKTLFAAFMLTYMLPSAATYVPSYVILAKMNLLDSLSGIIISNIGSVFSIYLIKTSFEQVPTELIEAARVDGANDLDLLWKVLMPFSKSSILTAALISFVGMYNNYMWPSLITKSKSKFLISVGLNQFFTKEGNFQENLPQIMAANAIAVLPLLILFIVLQKWFIKGISDNGIKG